MKVEILFVKIRLYHSLSVSHSNWQGWKNHDFSTTKTNLIKNLVFFSKIIKSIAEKY